jgi:hypothetical protein
VLQHQNPLMPPFLHLLYVLHCTYIQLLLDLQLIVYQWLYDPMVWVTEWYYIRCLFGTHNTCNFCYFKYRTLWTNPWCFLSLLLLLLLLIITWNADSTSGGKITTDRAMATLRDGTLFPTSTMCIPSPRGFRWEKMAGLVVKPGLL